ncbi:ABC transporter permease [Pedobacter sp. P351]|uniref:ABC transporter permease n=1 Tax=Pedobacter superstes TaxID=3133441 RepID=UPI0030AD6ED5
MKLVEEEIWDHEVTAKNNIFDLHLKDVWNYRDLIMLFVWRDFVSQYKQTILGPAWQFVQPALTTVIFVLLFHKIAKIPTDGIAPVVFYMAGITMWNYFSNCMVTISNTFVSNAYIFGKVYFPRLVLPVSLVISNLIKFGVQFLLLVVVMIYYHFNGYPIQIDLRLFFLPLLLFEMAALSLGLGIVISSITTKYRDFGVLLTFAIQLLMYATPVVYPLSYLKGEGYKWIIDINPLTSIMESFRLILLNQGTVSFNSICYSIVFTVIAFVIGLIMFNKVEKTFIDTV